MTIKAALRMIALEQEVNQLRAEKFIHEQRMKEAEAFMRRVACDLEVSRKQALCVRPGSFNHPALTAYDKRRNAFELVSYLFQIFKGEQA